MISGEPKQRGRLQKYLYKYTTTVLALETGGPPNNHNAGQSICTFLPHFLSVCSPASSSPVQILNPVFSFRTVERQTASFGNVNIFLKPVSSDRLINLSIFSKAACGQARSLSSTLCRSFLLLVSVLTPSTPALPPCRLSAGLSRTWRESLSVLG